MLKNFTLLYVEDHEDTVEAMRELLEEKVKELYVAYDGVEALKLYKQLKPDIVLTDINMPKMNGLVLAKSIKKINKDTPIGILTAFNEKQLLHESVALGIDCYITKPILDLHRLMQPLEKIALQLQGKVDAIKLQKLLEIQSKNAALGEMIGNISHQWRQPLSVITTHASHMNLMMEMNQEITYDMIKECTNGIMSQAEYLSTTVDDFRDFFKADISKIEKIKLQYVLHKALDLVQSSLKNNYITLVVELCEKGIFVNINENQLIQALLNICNNAKDAMVEQDGEKYFFVKLSYDANNAFVTLTDSGGGVPNAVVDKIFEPYFTTKHPSVGTGIGLYMTYNIIVSQLNGSIEVKNSKYRYDKKNLQGASFAITLPLFSPKSS